MPPQTVLLAGATGMLGARIAEHLLDADGVAVRLLVRQRALDDLENGSKSTHSSRAAPRSSSATSQIRRRLMLPPAASTS
jgi:thioester reductase-like protein